MNRPLRYENKGQYFECKDGSEYVTDSFGTHQLNPKHFEYDTNYCAIYDNPERKAKSDLLQGLRLGFIMGAHGSIPETILDYGSGNFAFLSFARKTIPFCYGYDIANYPVANGIIKTENWQLDCEVVTFHDSIEHVEEPAGIINKLNCDTIIISLPFCHIQERGREWFENNYFHRKPGEHLHHYSPETLGNFMKSLGWKSVATSNHEDHVREREGESWNILSMAFKHG